MNQTFFDPVNSKCISFDGVPKIAGRKASNGCSICGMESEKERKRSMTVFDANCIYTIKCLALIFVAAPGAMLIGALLIYLFALCCKQISGLWREQK